MEKKSIRGHCHCGKVKFSLQPPTNFVAHCHCQSCRQTHGAAFVTWTSVPKERFIFESGEQDIRWYASSEWIEWGFCSHCGSSMLYRAIKKGHAEDPKIDRVYATVANLIDPVDRDAKAHVSYEERVAWCSFADKLPKYRGKSDEEMPN